MDIKLERRDGCWRNASAIGGPLHAPQKGQIPCTASVGKARDSLRPRKIRSTKDNLRRVNQKMTQTEEVGVKTLSSVWVSCPYPAVALGLEKMLEAKEIRVYGGQKPPVNESPNSVVLCPKGEDVGSEVRRLQALAPGVPVLVFGLRVDTRLARMALLVGAHGFIHLGMQPAQIVHALSAAFAGETLVPRDLLEAFLIEMASRINPAITPHQQEFLWMVATLATFSDDIVVSRELFEAFLGEAAVT